MMTVLRDRDGDRELKAISNELRRNLKAVVFDEADRLLRTEVKARDAVRARQLRESGETASFTQKKKRSIKRTKPQAEQLLNDIPVPLGRLQVVCASATVGRTLRRQLMDLLQTPSLDKTAVLITAEGDVRTGKDVEKRKASLLPDTLRHRYRLLPDIDKSSPDNGLADSVAALHETMRSLDPPAPALVFPGKLGVEAVRNALAECGLKCVLGLKDVHLSKEGATKSWEDTQIFVIDNQFGRGLDVLGVRYVFLLSPPSSAAGYTHLSGRTGRNGKEGTAITFTRPREAHKLVAIADAVGLSFEDIAGDSKQASALSSAGSEESNPWRSLSESALKRKTVAELKDYLATQGVVLNDSSRILKADLLDAIDKLPKGTDR
jgi:superfamily II DNA/RNA helicase